jgi:homospermidine synthase
VRQREAVALCPIGLTSLFRQTTHEIFVTVEAPHKLIILGMGAIGRGVLPMILRHIKIELEQIVVASARDEEREVAEEHGVKWTKMVLSEHNYRELLTPLLTAGDVFLNLSSCVSSIDVIKLCQEKQVSYIDSSNETWDDSPEELHLTWGRYVAKERALKKVPGTPTALMSHGANPGESSIAVVTCCLTFEKQGMVNHFVKHAMLVMARDEFGADFAAPKSQEEWAQLCKRLEIQLIQISERDTQKSSIERKLTEFTCTWCVSAMMDESSEPSHVPLGTHEPAEPITNRTGSVVRLDPGAPPTWFSPNFAGNNTVRSWNPVCHNFLGNLIPHDETFSMCRYFSPADGSYRPTLYFAYQPCNDAILSQRDWFSRYPQEPSGQRLLLNDIESGQDILGVLICRRCKPGRKHALWYGSLMSIEDARSRLPDTSATTLSVVATVLAGLVWVIKNPRAGFVEPDDVPHDGKRIACFAVCANFSSAILPIILPYIEPMAQEYTDW